jgi:dihydrofolate reductase
LHEAIAACAGDEEVFIVGGAELYKQALPLADTLYLTEIQQEVEGDAHFPAFDTKNWQEITREARQQTVPQALSFHFITYRRKN